jgi:hypothetical protein
MRAQHSSDTVWCLADNLPTWFVRAVLCCPKVAVIEQAQTVPAAAGARITDMPSTVQLVTFGVAACVCTNTPRRQCAWHSTAQHGAFPGAVCTQKHPWYSQLHFLLVFTLPYATDNDCKQLTLSTALLCKASRACRCQRALDQPCVAGHLACWHGPTCHAIPCRKPTRDNKRHTKQRCPARSLGSQPQAELRRSAIGTAAAYMAAMLLNEHSSSLAPRPPQAAVLLPCSCAEWVHTSASHDK